MYDMIIVGGGPAGLTAAIYAKRAGYTALILEGGVLGGQAATTPEIENWPGTERLSGAEFSTRLYEQSKALGADIRFEAVTGFQDGGRFKTVQTASGVYDGRTVIIANGVRRRKLEVPGEERLAGRGVSYCATCDGNFFRGKNVAVAGGGNTALEDALFLANLCPQVYLIHRRDSFRAERHLADELAETANVRILMECRVLEIVGGSRVEGILVEDGRGKRVIAVSGVFAAVGLSPDNAAFAPIVALDEKGYIRAGEDTRTNVPGVFAAGDTRTKELRQLVTAASDGATAANQAGRYLKAMAQ